MRGSNSRAEPRAAARPVSRRSGVAFRARLRGRSAPMPVWLRHTGPPESSFAKEKPSAQSRDQREAVFPPDLLNIQRPERFGRCFYRLSRNLLRHDI